MKRTKGRPKDENEASVREEGRKTAMESQAGGSHGIRMDVAFKHESLG